MPFTKKIIDNPINIGLLLEFNTAFPFEVPLSVEKYLIGGSRDTILNVAAFFLGFKNNKSKFKDNKELLKGIFGPKNSVFSSQVYTVIKDLEAKGYMVGIINTYSSLKLFEIFFKKAAEQETQSPDEFEVNLFKAYLVLNSEYTARQQKAFDSTKDLNRDLAIPMMMFCMNYPVWDKQHYDITEIWITQIIKSIHLFQFLEENKKMEVLFREFLAYFEVSSWQDYLKSLIPLTLSNVFNDKEGHTDFAVTKDLNFNKSCAFIDKLIIDDHDELNENDFISLRLKPFYKIDEGVYRIIFNLFVVEKIFKGMYFLLKEVNERLRTGQIKELRSIYGDYFSERILFYKTIELIYPVKCIKFSGQQLVEMGILGGPDYYVRKHKDILIFESKDFLIPSGAKESFDFTRYEEEFEKKLYFEEKNGIEKFKGVMQLITFIKKLLKNEFPADVNYNYREVSIFPILIVHDHQYNTPGFNSLINYWFQAELELIEEEGFYTKRIKPLVVVDIDSLIYHQVGLLEDITLNEVIEKYAEHIKRDIQKKFRSNEEFKSYLLTRQIAFSTFITNYFVKEGFTRKPPILEQLGPLLFKNDLANESFLNHLS